MIGVGRDFPRCPQHVVANLSGSVNGTPPILMARSSTGRTTRRSSRTGSARSSEACAAARATPVDRYGAFNGHGSRFIDDVRSWQTVEPAIDFSAAAALAFALLR